MPRHRFLLDENILYHAIRGVDAHDNPDQTAAKLIETIAKRCHRIVGHTSIIGKYWKHLSRLVDEPAAALEPAFFIIQLLNNFPKVSHEVAELPEIPEGVRLPAEDRDLVRAALVSRPILVSADDELLQAVRAEPSLELTAMSPGEALVLADEPAVEEAGPPGG